MKADLNLIALNVLRSDTLEMIDDFPVRMSRYSVRTVRSHAFKDRARNAESGFPRQWSSDSRFRLFGQECIQ